MDPTTVSIAKGRATAGNLLTDQRKSGNGGQWKAPRASELGKGAMLPHDDACEAPPWLQGKV